MINKTKLLNQLKERGIYHIVDKEGKLFIVYFYDPDLLTDEFYVFEKTRLKQMMVQYNGSTTYLEF